MSGNGKRTVAIVVVLGLVAFGLGILAAVLGGPDEPTVEASAPPSATPTLSPTASRTETGTASESATPSLSPSPASPTGVTVEDGRYFARARAVTSGAFDQPMLSFDPAEFLTGPDAQAAAEADGEDAASGYYIVDHGHRVLRADLGRRVDIEYIPVDSCCEVRQGSLDAWIAALEGADNGYAGADAWWWIVVDHGRVIGIEEQYLP
jgi:hypothetical protein